MTHRELIAEWKHTLTQVANEIDATPGTFHQNATAHIQEAVRFLETEDAFKADVA